MPVAPEQDPSDFALIQKLIKRDIEALKVLYSRYHNVIYSIALRVLGDTGLAEEIIQDTFMDLWQHPENWDPYKGRLMNWLLSITRNKAIDRLRKENRHLTRQILLNEDDTIPGKVAMSSGDPRWENGQLLRSLLTQLPPEQALAIKLAFFQGLSHSELAEVLNLPLGTVKTRLRLGLQKLRELWGELPKSDE